jgi:hypothetical protein
MSEVIPIKKPDQFDLTAFKSKRGQSGPGGVETLLQALPVMKLSEAKDFVRLHPDEEGYWSDELCFINVPVKGQRRDTIHIINEDLAIAYGLNDKVQRYRLALASKPQDTFFLCIVPSTNLDNEWNRTALAGCEQGKHLWTSAVSKKDQGAEGYTINKAFDNDAFAEPKWPTQSLSEIISRAFDGRAITADDHPGLARVIGAKVAFG